MYHRLAPAAIAAALAVLAVPAAAQDATDFTGPRVEAEIGIERLDFDLSEYGVDGSARDTGVSYGGTVGYDVALGPKLVAGVEASLSFSSTDETFTDSASLGYAYRTGRELGLAARLGTPVSANTLLYGKLGYTNLRLGVDSDDGTVSTSADLDGIELGAGTEVKLSPRTYLKAEYDYSNYEAGLDRHQVLTGIGIRF